MTTAGPQRAEAPITPAQEGTRDEISSFLRSSAVVGLLTLLSRLTGFIREILVASAFGTTSAASSLVVAQTVPNLSRALASEEVAHGALVPALAQLEAQRRKAAEQRLVWSAAACATIVLAAVTLAVLGAASFVAEAIAPGQREQEQEQTATLMRLLAPVILFNGLLGASSALLVTKGRFAAVGLGATFSNIPVLLGLLLVPGATVEQVALLLVAGYALQAIFLFFAATRGRLRISSLLPPKGPERSVFMQDLRGVVVVAPPIVISLGMANLSGIVDMAFCSLISTGAPAAFDKAFRLVLLPYGVFALAIGIVALPGLSRAVGHATRFDQEVARAVRLQAVVLVPLAVIIGVVAPDLVRIAYERGEFDARSSALTANALIGAAVALPALGLSLVGTRAWFARQQPWRPARIAAIGLVFNAILDAVLIRPFGVMGVGLATAAVHSTVGTYLLVTAATDSRALAKTLVVFAVRLGIVVSVAAGLGAALLAVSGAMSPWPSVLLGLGSMPLVARMIGLTDYQALMGALSRGRQ